MCLALDTSQLWHRFVIVRLALIDRGRALPLGSTVLASQSATVGLDQWWVAVLIYGLAFMMWVMFVVQIIFGRWATTRIRATFRVCDDVIESAWLESDTTRNWLEVESELKGVPFKEWEREL